MLDTLLNQSTTLTKKESYIPAIYSICFIIKVLYQASDAQLVSLSPENMTSLKNQFWELKSKATLELQKEYLCYLLSLLERYSKALSINIAQVISDVQNAVAKINQQTWGGGAISFAAGRNVVAPSPEEISKVEESLKHYLQALERIRNEGGADAISAQEAKISELLTDFYIKIARYSFIGETNRIHQDLFVSQKQGVDQFTKDMTLLLVAFERRLSLGLFDLAGQMLNYSANEHHKISDFPIEKLLGLLIKLNAKIIEEKNNPTIDTSFKNFSGELVELRRSIRQSLTGDFDVVAVQSSIREKMQSFVHKLFLSSQDFVGIPPCSFVYVGNGSYALGAPSINSDIEGQLILAQMSPETLKYFQLYLVILNLEMTALSSHARASSLHFDALPRVIDSANKVTNGIYTMESYLPSLQDPDFIGEDSQRAFPLFFAGDETLYEEVIANIAKNNFNQSLWIELFKRAVRDFNYLAWKKDEFVEAVNIKSDCLQPLVVLLVRLRFYLQLPQAVGRHPVQIVNALKQQGYLSPEYSKLCIQTLSRWYRLRLCIQNEALLTSSVADESVPLNSQLRSEISRVLAPLIEYVGDVAERKLSRVVSVDPRYFPLGNGSRYLPRINQQAFSQKIRNNIGLSNNASMSLKVEFQTMTNQKGIMPISVVNALQDSGLLLQNGKWNDSYSGFTTISINDQEYLFLPCAKNALSTLAGMILASKMIGSIIPPFELIRVNANNNVLPVILFPLYRGTSFEENSEENFNAIYSENSRAFSELVLLMSILNIRDLDWKHCFFVERLESRENVSSISSPSWIRRGPSNAGPVGQSSRAAQPARLALGSRPEGVLKSSASFSESERTLVFYPKQWPLLPSLIRQDNSISITQAISIISSNVLKNPFSVSVANEFLALDVSLIINQWIGELENFQRTVSSIFTEAELKQFFSFDQSLPFCFPHNLIMQLVHRVSRLHEALKENGHPTCLQVIQMAEPLMGCLLENILSNDFDAVRRNAFLSSPFSTNLNTPLPVHQAYVSMFRSGNSQNIYDFVALGSGIEALNNLQIHSGKFLLTLNTNFLGWNSSIIIKDRVNHDELSRQSKENPDCETLVLLNIGNFEIKDFKALAKYFPRLKNLHIQTSNQVASLECDTPFVFLERLSVDGIPGLKKLEVYGPRLEYLHLKRCPLEAAKGELPGLKYLVIENCNIAPERLKSFIIGLKAIKLEVLIAPGMACNLAQIISESKTAFSGGVKTKQIKPKKIAKSFFDSAKEKYDKGLLKDALSDLTEAIRYDDKNVGIYKLLTEVYEKLEDHQKSLEAASRAYELVIKKKDAEVVKKRGLAHFNLAHYREAQSDFGLGINLNPKDLSFYFHRARCHYYLNDFEDALSDLGSASELSQFGEKGFYLRGLVYVGLNQFDKAMQDFDAAINIKRDPLIYKARANLKFRKKLFAGASNDLDNALSFNSKDGECHELKGMIFLERQDYPKARDAFQSAINFNSSSASAHFHRGVVLQCLDDNQSAIESFDRAIELNAKNGLAYLYRGVSRHACRQYEPALSDLNKAVSLMPSNLDAYTKRGALLFDMGKHEKGLEDIVKSKKFTQASGSTNKASLSIKGQDKELDLLNQQIQSNPRNIEALVKRIEKKFIIEDYVGAIQDCDRIIKINSKHELAFFYKANAYFGLGNNSQATACFEFILKNNPNNAFVMANLATCKMASRDFQSAIEDLDRAIIFEGSDASHFFQRGVSRMALAQYQGAIDDFNAAIAFHLNIDEVYEFRGDCYLNLGKSSEARDDYLKSLQLNPNNRSVKRQLGLLIFISGGYQGAIKVFNELLREADADSSQEKSNLYFLRGACYQGLALFRNAISDYDQAIVLDKNSMHFYTNRFLTKLSLYRNVLDAKQDSIYAYLNRDKFLPIMLPFGLFCYGYFHLLEGKYDEALRYFNEALSHNVDDPNGNDLQSCAYIGKAFHLWLTGAASDLIDSKFKELYEKKMNTHKIKGVYCGDIMARFIFCVITQNNLFKIQQDRLVKAFIEVMKMLENAKRDYPSEIKMFYYQAELFILIGQRELAHQLLQSLTIVDGEQLYTAVLKNMPSIDGQLKSILTRALPECGITPLEIEKLEEESIASSEIITTVAVSPNITRKPLPKPPVKQSLYKAATTTPSSLPPPSSSLSSSSSLLLTQPTAFFSPSPTSKSQPQANDSSPTPFVPKGKSERSETPEKRQGFIGRMRGSGDPSGKAESKSGMRK